MKNKYVTIVAAASLAITASAAPGLAQEATGGNASNPSGLASSYGYSIPGPPARPAAPGRTTTATPTRRRGT